MPTTIIAKGHKTDKIIQELAPEVFITDTFETGVTKSQLLELIDSEIPVDGFIGGVEVDVSILEEEVPEAFTGAVEEPVLWKDYCTHNEKDGKTLIELGYRDKNGNRPGIVLNEEFRLWVNHFGKENILTKSEFLKKLNEYKPSLEDDGQ